MDANKHFQSSVVIFESIWIPMRDGRRLAARLFLPREAESTVPVILEYIPYRRRDGTREHDDATHCWFAANGYACIRVDIAGSGDSDGLVQDEYHPREQEDALDVIEWLVTQEWCSGSVGMIGISWGGFNGLQVAALRPPALKAVISLSSTVDRYNTDVHFMGGCLLNDNIDWGAAFFTYGALPPDPAVVGEDWREIWRSRIDGLELYPALWLEHQRRDAYWKHGSVIEDFAAIQTPILAVSGWADGYTSTVFQLVNNLSSGCKGIVGPWGHVYPQHGVPGPAIGFLQECKRWWDRWLKGIKNGVEEDPALRLWLQEPTVPLPHYENRPGRWLGLGADLSRVVDILSMPLTSDATPHRGKESVQSPQTVGVRSGEWCAYVLGKVAPEMPIDQNIDDAGSLVVDFPVLDEAMSVVGQGFVRLRLSVDKPQAFLAARISDIDPNGAATRITYGLLNLTHRSGHEEPKALVPNQTYDVSIPLKEIGQRVEAGHHLRLAISTSYWPTVWPSPEAAVVTVDKKASVLEIPVLRSDAIIASVHFDEVEHAPPASKTVIVEGNEARIHCYDVGTATTRFVASRDDGWSKIDDIDTAVHYSKSKEFTIRDDDPLSSQANVKCNWAAKRDDWNVSVRTECTMSATLDSFILVGKYMSYEDGKLFSERSFECVIPRDHV